MPPCFLDHNSTTPLDPEVRTEMVNVLSGPFGNASSHHSFGKQARGVVETARMRVARLLGASPDEIVFTSGGTEANNLALLGAVGACENSGCHVVATPIEHPSVLNPLRHLEEARAAVTLVSVSPDGVLDPERAIASFCAETRVLSVMLANNDTGVLQPVAMLSKHTQRRGVLLHSDAVAAVGKVPVDVDELGVDLLSFSGHKIHGPKGAAVLFVRRGTKLSALMFGGRQEHGFRPGTENVAAIAGLGKACELAAQRLTTDSNHLRDIQSMFEAAILSSVKGATVNGATAPRVSNTSNVSFPGVNGKELATRLDSLGVAVSIGAACSSAGNAPSHVLMAMGRSASEARSSVRFSFGRGNTREEVSQAAELVAQAVAELRAV